MELLRELKRAREGSIPPYSEDTIRQVSGLLYAMSVYRSCKKLLHTKHSYDTHQYCLIHQAIDVGVFVYLDQL